MSNFKVTNEVLNKSRRNYRMNNDLLEGFKEARRNGQQLLALEYAELIFDMLNEKQDAEETAKSTNTVATSKKTASAKAESTTQED